MAVFPTGFPGVAPADPETPVGKFRLEYGDTEYTEYDPPVADVGNYSELSDAEIENLLASGGDSVSGALGKYYLALSGHAAQQAKLVKDYDLQINLMDRSTRLLAVANRYLEEAGKEDRLAGGDDIFMVHPVGNRQNWIPEASPPRAGRRYIRDVMY